MKPMQIIGLTVCVIGLFAAIAFFLAFDTSVETDGGGRVNNLGLMNQRQNGIIISGVMAIVGVVLFAVGSTAGGSTGSAPNRGSAKRVPGGLECPTCRLISPRTALRCDCGFLFQEER